MITQVSFPGKTVTTYSLAAAAGLIAAVIYIKKRVKDSSFTDLDRYIELELAYGLTGAAIGAKLLYLLIEFRQIIRNINAYGASETCRAYLAGGFVFYGGMIGCIAAVYMYCRSSKVPFAHSLQLLLPALPLAHSFGRIGCFITGCCYGTETYGWLHVIYSHSQFAPNGVPLIPIQFIEALYELVLFLVLYRDSKRDVSGDVMLCKYAVLYGAGRFLLEFFRGDAYRGFIGALSVSQVISLICIAAGTAYMLYSRYYRRKMS